MMCFSDILASAIRLCVYPIDFSIYAACPRAHEHDRELSVSGVKIAKRFYRIELVLIYSE